MADGDFSIEAFNYNLSKVYKKSIFGFTPERSPRAFVLGGQPGAGKTGLQKIMSQQCHNNLIIINADEFRELHPDFKHLQAKYGKDSVDYTGSFTGRMTEELIEMLKTEQYNVLVEGTLRTADVPLRTCSSFKECGYTVTLAIMAVKPEISYLSTIMRYENMIAEGKTPRATSKSSHDKVVAAIPDNLRRIYDSHSFDNIVIYDRDGKCLYDLSEEEQVSPDTVIKEVFNRKWTQHEFEQFCSIGRITQELMEKRQAPELADYSAKYFNNDIVSMIVDNNSLTVTDVRNRSEKMAAWAEKAIDKAEQTQEMKRDGQIR